jgi:chromate transporter
MTRPVLEVLATSFKLGLGSFGGPIAHLGYFHREYVVEKRWLDEEDYADLVALCQLLPGPASSQLGISIGMSRAGLAGGMAAWLGFTLPSAFIMIAFALLLQGFEVSSAGWIHGLKLVAVAIVAQAVLGMGRRLSPDRGRATIAVAAMAVVLLWKVPISQILVIAAAGLVGLAAYRKVQVEVESKLDLHVSRRLGIVCLALFVILLVALPLLRQAAPTGWLGLADGFYRSGSLVFGGGHVVLPLLQKEVVQTGWVSQDHFLAGYAMAQAIPGPLFTFAGYLGAMIGGIGGGLLALVSLFLPGFLLIVGALPFWDKFRRNPSIQGAVVGINAAVVGILLAALYDPICLSAIHSSADLVLALALLCMLLFWKAPSWMVVALGALGGALLPWLSRL